MYGITLSGDGVSGEERERKSDGEIESAGERDKRGLGSIQNRLSLTLLQSDFVIHKQNTLGS